MSRDTVIPPQPDPRDGASWQLELARLRAEIERHRNLLQEVVDLRPAPETEAVRLPQVAGVMAGMTSVVVERAEPDAAPAVPRRAVGLPSVRRVKGEVYHPARLALAAPRDFHAIVADLDPEPPPVEGMTDEPPRRVEPTPEAVRTESPIEEPPPEPAPVLEAPTVAVTDPVVEPIEAATEPKAEAAAEEAPSDVVVTPEEVAPSPGEDVAPSPVEAAVEPTSHVVAQPDEAPPSSAETVVPELKPDPKVDEPRTVATADRAGLFDAPAVGTEPVAGAAAEPSTAVVPEPAAEPIVDVATEPVVEVAPAPSPVPEPVPEPIAEAAPVPVAVVATPPTPTPVTAPAPQRPRSTLVAAAARARSGEWVAGRAAAIPALAAALLAAGALAVASVGQMSDVNSRFALVDAVDRRPIDAAGVAAALRSTRWSARADVADAAYLEARARHVVELCEALEQVATGRASGYPAIQADLARSAAAAPASPWAALSSAQLAAGQADAADAWRRLSELPTAEPLVWQQLANRFRLAGDHERAAAAYRRFLERRPAETRRALMLLAEVRVPPALLIRAVPDDAVAALALAKYLQEEAGADWRESVEPLLTRIAARGPIQSLPSLSAEGTLRQMLGQWRESAVCLERALRLKPDHPPAMLELARARYALGEYAESDRLADRVARLDPTGEWGGQARTLRGKIELASQGRFGGEAPR